ncbi:GTP-binding protein [Streptomyces sp. NBC_01433]|uniref:CobW family GTP-binding protein n=1 Tax=Streptomyces sp. NBC_01433 TaxID=2903864 RepID=UPI0022576181|nr:GTP-binding protein [Streptomyces sp. NBC_01433]MCX4673760.1 GTP-binding protein [Streptomyces sp. NBC_01433]
MTPPRTPQIPVVVLAGFLGSGKTTLLNHLLRNRAGNRIGVIVNDFGAIEIDAMTVAGQVGSTVSLGNGCLCCAVDASELDTFLETLTRPSARLDVIVIEASGLAEPQELVRMLLASDNPHILYGGLVEVVDAAEFDRTRERHPEIDRHLAVADLVVLNKTDRVDGAEHERLRAEVAALGSRAAVISAVHGRIDPELLFDPAVRPDAEEKARQLTFEDLLLDACEPGEEGHASHLHAAYESVAFTSDEPMDPRRFLAFLDSRPEGLYRIKGFADFGEGDRANTYALHAVGRFLRFVPRPWARGERRLTQLVLIGSGIDAESLRKELADCRVPGDPGNVPHDARDASPGAEPHDAHHGVPHDARQDASHDDASRIASQDHADRERQERQEYHERGMWGVLRYVQQPADAD